MLLQTDPTENHEEPARAPPEKASASRYRAITEAARNSAQNIRHSFPIQLPRLTGGSSLPHSHNTSHSSSPGAAKVRKVAAPGLSTAGRELKKKSMFIGG